MNYNKRAAIIYLLLCSNQSEKAIDLILEYTKNHYLKTHEKSERPLWEKILGSFYADDLPEDFDANILPVCALVKAEYEDDAAFFGLHELKKTEYDVSHRNLSVPRTVLSYDILCATQNLELTRIRHENAKKITYVALLLRDSEMQLD